MSTMDRDKLWIGGTWTTSAGGEVVPLVSPSTGAAVAQVRLASEQDAELAIAQARTAFDRGPWRRMTPEKRAAVVMAARDIVAERSQEIARVITTEMGAPLAAALAGVEASGVNYMTDAATRGPGLLEPEIVDDPKGKSLVLREPVGVLGAIAPWNGPFAIAAGKIVPALMSGCSVVFKPSPQTPLDAYFLADALTAAGLPDGVLSVIPGGSEVGELLVGHSGIDAISFTGSTAVGRAIGAACGQQVKRAALELGGKSAAIVLDDADLDKVASVLAAGVCQNSGQACISLSRILAPRGREDEVIDAVRTALEKLVVGDPFDPKTTMGPLVSSAHRDRVEGYIKLGAAEGAQLVTGGGRPAHLDRGWFVEPTLFTGVDNSMRIAREEIFGPVGCVIGYDSLDEAIDIANDSEFGLHGAVMTQDPQRAMEVASRVRTGTFAINGYGFNVASPFGGVKCSGSGREHGAEGILASVEFKSIKLSAEPAMADLAQDGRGSLT